MTYTGLLHFWFALGGTLLVFSSASASSGHDLWTHLFENKTYNKFVRPVQIWTTPTIVNISVSLIAIIEFNEVKQTLILTSKVTFQWMDEFLNWDPGEFENINHIHVEQGMVWKPYIFLENSVTKQSELGTNSLSVIVDSDGKLEWNPTEVFQITCTADVRNFPFDTQTCTMVFEAVGYTGSELAMQSINEHVDFHGTAGTAGWVVEETEMMTNTEGENIHIISSITLRRNPMYFILNVLLPIVLLSTMNIFVFVLPVESGEKAGFVITVFLSLAVFLTIVSSNLPENSESVSILNVYVFMNTLLSVVIAMVTIVQIRLFHRDPEIPVPKVLEKIAMLFTKQPSGMVHQMTKTENDETQETKTVNKLNKKRNSQPTTTYNTLFASESTVGWPHVVKAFDNIFFVVFLTINLVITVTIFALAVHQQNPADDDHGEEH